MKSFKYLVLNIVLRGFRFGPQFRILVLIIFACMTAGAQSSQGTLVVRGEAGPSQIFRQVKAARCNLKTRSCSNVEYFDLNQVRNLSVGSYILGFENSIYPGWVHIRAGQTTTLDLVKLSVPSSLSSETQVRVFRDFESQIEKDKLFFVQFYMARPLFRLSQYNFGDLYLASPGMPDVTLRLNYDICNSFKTKNSENEEAVEICLTAANAQSWRDMSGLFKFNGRDHMNRDLVRGQYIQNLVSEAGDRRQILMRRQLVSAPMKGSDFVSVFPGQYRFASERKGGPAQSVQAGAQEQNFD